MPDDQEIENFPPPTHFSSEMFKTRQADHSFGVNPLQASYGDSHEWHREVPQPSLYQNSCHLPRNETYEPFLSHNANTCPVSSTDLVPEQPVSHSNRTIPRYDNRAMLKLASSFGLDSERLSLCYEKLEKPENFRDDSSFLGGWMEATEAKNTLLSDAVLSLIDAVRDYVSGLKSDTVKQAGESAECRNSIGLLSSRMEQIKGEFVDENRHILSKATFEATQSFQGSLQVFKDQVASQFERTERLIGSSQSSCEEYSKRLTEEVQARCGGLIQDRIQDTQVGGEKFARETAERLVRQENAMLSLEKRLDSLSGEFPSTSHVKQAFADCEEVLKAKLGFLEAKVDKVSQELSAAVPLIRSALQPSNVDDHLAKSGLGRFSSDLGRLTKDMQTYQATLTLLKKETSQTLQDLSISLKKIIQEESSKRAADLNASISALRTELSEIRTAGQNELESRLLACEGQMGELLGFQKDLKQELSKGTIQTVASAQIDPKQPPKATATDSGSEKEFRHYKNVVDQHSVSLKEFGHELRVWRKECSLLAKRFEDFCPEGCLAIHKGTKATVHTDKVSEPKNQGTQSGKQPLKEPPKDKDGKNNKGSKKKSTQKPQYKGEQKAQSKGRDTGGKQGSLINNGEGEVKTSSHNPRANVRQPNSKDTRPQDQREKLPNNKPKDNEKNDWVQVSKNSSKNKKGYNNKPPSNPQKSSDMPKVWSESWGTVKPGGQKGHSHAQAHGASQKGIAKPSQAANPTSKPPRQGTFRHQSRPFFPWEYRFPSWGFAQPGFGPYSSLFPPHLGYPTCPTGGYGNRPF